MNKNEYRERVLKRLEAIELNTEVTGIFSMVADILLFFIMFFIVLLK